MDFMGLPTDVRSLIASYLPKPDLRSLRDTSKKMYDAAIPYLFRQMVIHEGSNGGFATFIPALSPDNAGLQHVRHLAIVAKSDDYRKSAPEINMLLMLVGNLFPRDVLLTFTCDCASDLASSALTTLHSRQRSLRTIRVNGRLEANSVVQGKISMKAITCIHFEVASTAAAKDCGRVLEHASALRSLELRVDLKQYCSNGGMRYRDMAGRASASAKIVEDLFEYPLCTTKKPMQLLCLRLFDLELSTAAPKLLQAVDCSRLHSLGIQRCGGSIEMLRLLRPTGIPARMTMRSLLLTTADNGPDQDGDDEDDRGVDNFLSSFHGLEEVVLRAPCHKALCPSITAIAAHADTLQLLFLDCRFGTERCYKATALEQCLKQCNKLGQLALNVPPLPLNLEERQMLVQSESFMNAIAAAPALRILRMLTVPTESDMATWDAQPSNNALGKTYVKAGLQKYANQCLAKIPNLKALSLLDEVRHPSATVHIGPAEIKPPYFGRGTLSDAYGRAETFAIEMSRVTMRDVEPVSDVFDLDVGGWRLLRRGYSN